MESLCARCHDHPIFLKKKQLCFECTGELMRISARKFAGEDVEEENWEPPFAENPTTASLCIKKYGPLVGRKVLWQKKNPEKVAAAAKARMNPDKLNIHFECPCDHPKKHNHHFDYNKPYDVFKLCPSCHSLEHKRLRSLNKFTRTLSPT